MLLGLDLVGVVTATVLAISSKSKRELPLTAKHDPEPVKHFETRVQDFF
jgi:hypothetical protein